MIEIKNRYTGAVIFSGEYATIREAVEAAVRAGVSLSVADLSVADLYGADLRGAELRVANLSGANLCDADLRDAELRVANLSYADLCGARFASASVSELRGVTAVAVTWPGHGECGRQLLAIADQDGPGKTVYHCGCFRGSRDELLGYIKRGAEALKPSRALTLDVVNMLLAASVAEHERRKGGK